MGGRGLGSIVATGPAPACWKVRICQPSLSEALVGEKPSSPKQIEARSERFWIKRTIARGGVGGFRRFQIHVAALKA